METPETRVQLIQSASVQLGQYLHASPAAAWRRPSACDRWEVRDVIGHLILGLNSTLTSSLEGCTGTSPPFKCRLFSYATLGSGEQVQSRSPAVSGLLGHGSGSMYPTGRG